MTWESAVIMGLCAYSALVTTGIYSILRREGVTHPDPDEALMGPIAYDTKKALDRAQAMPVNWATPARLGAKSEPPKDNGSVILMTPERDARLLQGEDD